MRKSKRRALHLLTALLAIAVAGVAVLDAQRVVRIVNGRPVFEDEDEAAKRKQEPPKADIKEIQPTPEEHGQIADLIGQLGAPRLAQRDRAMSELAQFEARALGQIRGAKAHDDDEIAMRCNLLEQVILSGQGELFLAARNLGLSIAELNAHLESSARC